MAPPVAVPAGGGRRIGCTSCIETQAADVPIGCSLRILKFAGMKGKLKGSTGGYRPVEPFWEGATA